MKTKIKAALQQSYKNLGLSDEVFERVAVAGETFIKDEADIQSYVDSMGATLKSIQSEADKVRGELSAKIKVLEGEKEQLSATLKEKSKNAEDTNEGVEQKQPTQEVDVRKLISDAVSEAVKPLLGDIENIKNSQAQKSAVATAIADIDGWDWAKAYPKERAKAQAQAMELYEAYGKKWTAEELSGKIREKFKAEISEKGLDVSKPYESDGDGASERVDFSDYIALLNKQGVDLSDKTAN